MTEPIATPAGGENAARPTRAPGRSVAMWIVLALAGMLLLLSSFAVWIDRVALNSEVFTDTGSSLLDDPTIRRAVATRAVDELFDTVDVEAELQGKLPKDFKSLSGPATAGLRQGSYEIVDRALEQPALQRLFRASLKESHRTLVELLRGGGPRVSTEGGAVTLDLRAIIREAADRIGIGEQTVDRIPAGAGRIVLLRSDQLDTAQDAFQLLERLSWILPLLALATFLAALALAPDRRRAVRAVGVVLALVGVVGLVAASLTKGYLVDSLVADSSDRRAARDAWDIFSELLRSSFRTMLVAAVLFLVAAWLAGPGRRALEVRRMLAPALRARTWAYLGLAAVTVIVLLAGDSVRDFTRALAVVLLVVLGATWIELTRARTLREFPDASGAAVVADVRTRVSEWWQRRQLALPTRERPRSEVDLTTRLASLADLHARGELTDEEYATAKTRVLAGE